MNSHNHDEQDAINGLKTQITSVTSIMLDIIS